MREFWIVAGNPLDKCMDAHVYDNKPVWAASMNPIHVIEKKEYLELLEQSKKLEIALSDNCGCTIQYGAFDPDNCQNCFAVTAWQAFLKEKGLE